MYTYKVKASINHDANNFDAVNHKLISVIKNSGLTDIGNCEYGTDNFSKGMSVILYLGESDWFLKNAQELKWFNGEDYDQISDYNVEDSLSFFLAKRG